MPLHPTSHAPSHAPLARPAVPEPALPLPDVFALKDRLHALFSRYGRVQRLDLVPADAGLQRRVMCFLRMGSAEDEQAVVEALGLGRFGGDLVMVVSLGDAHDPANPSWLAAATAGPQPPHGLA